MIPVEIRMENFLSYEDETFDFRNLTNATVVGNNGSGKSSFCTDAITWAIYGQGSKGTSNDNYVHEGEDYCLVEFSFEQNGNLYKIVRSYNIQKAKNTVNIFTINDDGDEIPLSSGSFRETQKYIEDLLRMSYKTFTASSMIFQNRSSEFTENMSDMERKEALVAILDIDEWDKIGRMANEDALNLRNEIKIKQNDIAHYNEIISNEKSFLKEKEEVLNKISDIEKKKEKQQSVLDENQKQIYAMDSLEKDLTRKQAEVKSANEKIFENQRRIKEEQTEIEGTNQKILSYEKQKEQSMKILDNKEKIEQAVKDEEKILNEINMFKESQLSFLTEKNILSEIEQKGKDWNATQKMRLADLTARIQTAEEQSKILSTIPCSSTVASSCPLLAMARKAQDDCQKYLQEKATIEAEKNPFRFQWKEQNEKVKAIPMVDETVLETKKTLLTEIQQVSRFKSALDIAADKINNLMSFIEESKNILKKKKKDIDVLLEENQKSKETVSSLYKEISSLSSQKEGFNEIKNLVDGAKKNLLAYENEEKDFQRDVAKYDTLLEQVKDAKTKVAEKNKEIDKMIDELIYITKMQEACSKKSGVPALIIENAVPELEGIANKVLDKMLDGRLQIRLDTQVETKSKNIQEVLRITVLDTGFARKYETYSGAEKFVVDLALRIAMSKFLTHRAGASIQLFVLDEGVSCADTINRDEIVSAIRAISDEFQKVLFVTHIEELKDSLEQKIFVTKDSQGSHINLVA